MPDFGRSGNYTPSFGSHKNRVEWEPLFEGLERTSSDSDIQPEEEVRPFFPESTEWGQASQEDAVTPSSLVKKVKSSLRKIPCTIISIKAAIS